MGRRNKRKRGDKGSGSGKDKPKKEGKRARIEWGDPESCSNELFFAFYKAQKIVPEGEWDAFVESLRTRLPISFRITAPGDQARVIRERIVNEYVPAFEGVELEGKPVPLPQPIPWAANEVAWQMDVSKALLRKHPQLKPFHQFLVNETEHGNLSRSETVSMLPPTFLNVEPHHWVLDMCAAPGSKTVQVVDSLHGEGELISEGLVVANDADKKRAYLLIHRAKRMKTPNLVVTHHQAQFFPRLNHPNPDGTPGGGGEAIAFDRVMCDVPCSGDGTIRKAPDMWRRWTPAMGSGLHPLQIDIAIRGVQLTKIGGRMVYSTCSLNPIENEAVVAEVLRQCKGCVTLVDARDELPGLQSEPGMTEWVVVSKSGKSFYSKAADVDPIFTNFSDSMFPPTAEEAAELGLERCVRILPHRANTGGFFVAVFDKVSEFPYVSGGIGAGALRDDDDDDDNDSPATAAAGGSGGGKGKGSADGGDGGDVDMTDASGGAGEGAGAGTDDVGMTDEEKAAAARRDLLALGVCGVAVGEDPFMPLPSDSRVKEVLTDFYGLGDDFPFDNLYVRNLDNMGKIYFLAPAVRQLIHAHRSDKMKLVNAGVKFIDFTPNKSVAEPARYRVTQDGVVLMHEYAKKRVIEMPATDFLQYSREEKPFFSSFSPETKAAFEALEPGCVIMRVTPAEGVPGEPAIVSAWRGHTSSSLFVPKPERVSVLMQLFGSDYKDFLPKTQAAIDEEARAAIAAAAAAAGTDGGAATETNTGTDTSATSTTTTTTTTTTSTATAPAAEAAAAADTVMTDGGDGGGGGGEGGGGGDAATPST